MHVASFFCLVCSCVVEPFLAELGCCHYQLTPSTPTPSVPGTIFMHNILIICSMVGGKIITSSHLSEFKPHLSYILCWILSLWSDIEGRRTTSRRSQAPPGCKRLQRKYYLGLSASDNPMGHSQTWWRSTELRCTPAAVPADTRQGIWHESVCMSWLSVMQRIRIYCKLSASLCLFSSIKLLTYTSFAGKCAGVSFWKTDLQRVMYT